MIMVTAGQLDAHKHLLVAKHANGNDKTAEMLQRPLSVRTSCEGTFSALFYNLEQLLNRAVVKYGLTTAGIWETKKPEGAGMSCSHSILKILFGNF